MAATNQTPCDCAEFTPIELDRASITRRIKESPAIRQCLNQIAENAELRLYLFRCPACGQLWQSGHEWNFTDREYVFQVPAIDIAEWQSLPYRQPAAMMIYDAVMQNFFSQAMLEVSDKPCREEECGEKAIQLSVFCRDHHVESLQKNHLLPKPPVGRMFPPYCAEKSNDG